MKSRLVIAFAILSVVITYHHADAKRGKARSLGVVIKEVNQIKEALLNETGNIQWTVSVLLYFFRGLFWTQTSFL